MQKFLHKMHKKPSSSKYYSKLSKNMKLNTVLKFTNIRVRRFSIKNETEEFEEKLERLRNYKTLEEHDPKVISHMIGNLLGDGHVRRRKLVASLRFHMSEKYLLYIKYLQTFYHSFGYCSKTELRLRPSNIVTKNNYATIHIQTRSLASLTILHEMFYRQANEKEKKEKSGGGYKKYIKFIPSNIADYLTPLALAVWHMDDGTFNTDTGRIALSTNSFTKKDIEILQTALKKNFNLDFSIYKAKMGKYGEQQWRLYLTKSQVSSFIEIVKEYIVPSMYYKLGLDFQLQPLKQTPTETEMRDFLKATKEQAPAALAKWVRHCASYAKRDRVIRLSTQQAEIEEIAIVQAALHEGFNLTTTTTKHSAKKERGYILRFAPTQTLNLAQIVKPYLDPSIYYKIGLDLKGNPLQTKK